MFGLLLILIGAILLWGVNWRSSSVNIDIIGEILIVVGAIAALAEAFAWTKVREWWRRW